MSGGQIHVHDTGITWLDVPEPDDSGDDGGDAVPESFHERVIAAGYVPAPICVIGAAGQRAEVYEKESGAVDRPARFLVRLVVPGACEHILTLADLPDLLEHFDRLSPLFLPLVGDARGRPRAASASGAPRSGNRAAARPPARPGRAR